MIKYKCIVYYDKNQNYYSVKLQYYDLRSLVGNKKSNRIVEKIVKQN